MAAAPDHSVPLCNLGTPIPMAVQIFSPEQLVAFELQGSSFKLHVGSVQVDVNGQNREVPRGRLMQTTAFIFTNNSEL